MNEKILIIEDDRKLRTGIVDNLQFEGYRVTETWSAELGAKVWFEIEPDIVILDLMLPGISGFQLLREMRARSSKTPVIILSARGEEWDKVNGFRLGCDDYLVKPFSILELIERIRAVLRRYSPEEPISDTVSLEGMKLNLLSLELKISNKSVLLSERLTELLAYFMRNQARVISRKELLSEVWLLSPDIETRTVDVHVGSLRKELSGSGYEIETVYKAGYRLNKI